MSVSENGFLYKDQRTPTVAVTASGRVLVCWEANTLAVETGWDIVCRLYQYSDLAPLTIRFKPPAYDMGAQNRPDLSVLAGTDFLLSWDTEQVDTTGSAIQYQRIDSQGAVVGPRVVANREWTGNQYKLFVTPLGAGTLAIGWEFEGQDGDLSGVFCRILPR